MNNSKYQITFDANKKHEIIIEDYKKNKSNGTIFFEDEYKKAEELVAGILDAWKKVCPSNLKKCCEEPDEKCPRKNIYADCDGSKNENPQNNIILFTGERGTGKTSAMLSFGKFLEEHGLEEYKNRNFKCLPMIDPSYFRKNENIVINVITVMFKMAKGIHSKKIKDASEYNKNQFNELLREYETVFTALKNMDGLKTDEQSLEYLNELADTTDLRKQINTLIKKMLDFISHDDKSNGKYDIMILMIDDLDMNVSFVPVMLEQIRKFLMMEDLIVLISSNIEQFQLEMAERYSKYFEKLLADPRDQNMVSGYIEDMANKYLLKLFPPSRRIHVGGVEKKLLETKIDIVLKKNDPNKEFAEKYKHQKLQNALLNLIWWRTRLIFVPEEGELHPIIPTNLRELNQFVFLLLDMEEVNYRKDPINKHIFGEEKDIKTVKRNFKKFKDYILGTWIQSKVSVEEWKVFENMPLEITRINKHLIQSINVIGNQHKKRLLARDVDLEQIEKNSTIKIDSDIYTMVSPNDPKFYMANRISDLYNYPSNNSMGDVLLLIDKYQTYFESVEESHFINAVKIYYSMLLFETMFFHSQIISAKANQSENIIDIQRLIGGTVYFPHYFDIIASDNYNFELSEEYNKGRGDHLFYHLRKINDSCLSCNLLEIFSVHYYGKKRPERSLSKHIYNTKRTSEDARFDILSLLCNTLNPIQTIERVNIDSYIKELLQKQEKDRADEININANEIKKKANDWLKQVFPLDKEDCEYPNFILPIYSVDLMLKYLREQFVFEEIAHADIVDKIKARVESLKETKENIRKKGSISESFNKDYLDTELNNNLDILKGIFENTTTFEDNKQLSKDETTNSDASNFANPNIAKFEKSVLSLLDYKSNVVELLTTYYDVNDNNERYYKLLRMIKEVQSKKTKAEIKFYLVSELWEKESQINIIHDYMQDQVRDFNFVKSYYDKLWGITAETFHKIDIDNNNQIYSIYEHIYQEGSGVFICNGNLNKTQQAISEIKTAKSEAKS